MERRGLVREFFKREGVDYLDFFIPVKSEKLILEDFSRELRAKLRYSPRFETFSEMFEYLEVADVEAVFFDEFQNVLRVNPAIAFDLQRFIDRNRDKPLLIILSGSYLGMMRKLLTSRKAPLYGRSTLFIELQPLRPRWVFEMLKDLGITEPVQQVEFYGIFGGIPKYYELLEVFEAGNPPDLIVDAVRYSTLLTAEGEGLLIDEFGKAYRTYFSILDAIASGKNRLVEIANAVGMKPGSITKYLEALEDYYGIITRERPLLGGRRSRYVISDYFLNFWFSLIEPNRRQVEAGDFNAFRRNLEGKFPEFFGRVFERVVLDLLHDLNGELITFDSIGPHWGRNYEIDLVAINREENIATFIETKWKTNVDGPREIGRLIAKAQNAPWRGEKRYLLIARGFRRECADCITIDGVLEHLKP
ncbi:ATP-binding protein [Thermococcus indicus]|uniref:ATP-binding protein n=1 Tax=Thermococcus indicus TaxID=2586643 RepID=A0A4Y5SNV5_9EURY|nr:ATP-binding protein [Thermococcus indicus]QDA31772.1 ATP-binding protein [Thermococcus indicus]